MIPVLDVSPLASPSLAERRAVARDLGEACRGIGFFLVTGHGVTTTEAAFAAARSLFGLPEAEKEALSIRHSPHNRGYVGLGVERLDPLQPGDRKEAFNIGLDLAADDPEVVAGMPFRGVNRWPSIPGWREAALAHFDACWGLGRLLHRAVALDLGLAEDWFEDKLDRPIATLRMLRYPGGGDGLGAGAHTDYGNLTILATDGVPGLEARTRSGEWVEVPHVPGALVCNIGDCLMRWTNGVYASTPHLVRAPAAERYSLAFFLDPNPDAVVEALPGCVAPGEAPRWPAITGAAYLRERLDATYGG